MDLYSVVRAIVALAFVLTLIWGGMWLLRRYGGKFIDAPTGQADKQMKVLETLNLQPRYKLLRIQNGAQEHVLLISPEGPLELSQKSATDISAQKGDS